MHSLGHDLFGKFSTVRGTSLSICIEVDGFCHPPRTIGLGVNRVSCEILKMTWDSDLYRAIWIHRILSAFYHCHFRTSNSILSHDCCSQQPSKNPSHCSRYSARPSTHILLSVECSEDSGTSRPSKPPLIASLLTQHSRNNVRSGGFKKMRGNRGTQSKGASCH